MKPFIVRAGMSYKNLSYIVIAAFLISSFIAPLFAAPQTAGSVSLTLTNISTGTFLGTRGAPSYSWASGTVIISGNYIYYSKTPFTTTTTIPPTTLRVGRFFASGGNGNSSVSVSGGGGSTTAPGGKTVINGTTYYTEPAPIDLSGNVTTFYMQTVNGVSHLANETAQITFSNPYYTGESASFFVKFPPTTIEYATVFVAAESTNGYLLAETSTTASPSTLINLFTTIVALPQFNDSMLGATVLLKNVNPGQPILPLGGLYNLLAIVSIVILAASMLFFYFAPSQKRPTFPQQFMKVVMGIVLVLVFPLIYNHIAALINLLNQTIIAYPGPAASYTTALASLFTNMILPANTNFVTILSTTLLGIAYFVVSLIVILTLYLVGTVRIFLLGGMIVIFSLSIALRDIPFTEKLGRMIEDTLFGVMTATILSAVMLGVASYILANWTTPGNIFVFAGIPSQWVAIASIIVAIFAPTVLAPLVSTTYQTTTQMAMAGGSVAAVVGEGFFGGGLTGGIPELGALGSIGGAGGTGQAASVGREAANNIPSGGLSVMDRIGGFALGGFLGAAELAIPELSNAFHIGAGRHTAKGIHDIRTKGRTKRSTATGSSDASSSANGEQHPAAS